MRHTSVWQGLLGLTRTVVGGWRSTRQPVPSSCRCVRPRVPRGRCGQCGRRAGRYDRGAGRRRWRALDVGELPCCLQADAPRVRCRTHGVVVAQVPWARHSAGHTRAFDDTVAWLTVRCSKSAVTELCHYVRGLNNRNDGR